MAKIKKGDTVRLVQPVIEGEVIGTSVNDDGDIFHTVRVPDPSNTDGDGDGFTQLVLAADKLEKVETPVTGA